MRTTIRVLFANCPRLDDAACAYLLLSQNRVQSVFQFEVYHLFVQGTTKADGIGNMLQRYAGLPWWVPLRQRAERRYRARLERLLWPPLQGVLSINECLSDLQPYAAAHDAWLRKLPDYGNWSMGLGPWVILTETPLSGGYLSMVGSDLAVINLASWRKYAPPSVVEYALVQVQRAALRMAITDKLSSHYPTRGCAWDFTAHQPDARMCVVGTLCDSCWTVIREHVTEPERAELEHLLSHKWIGKTDEAGAVASTIKRVFGYDLALTRGLSPTFLENLRQSLPSGVITLLVAAVGAVVSVLFILFTAWLRHMGWIK